MDAILKTGDLVWIVDELSQRDTILWFVFNIQALNNGKYNIYPNGP